MDLIVRIVRKFPPSLQQTKIDRDTRINHLSDHRSGRTRVRQSPLQQPRCLAHGHRRWARTVTRQRRQARPLYRRPRPQVLV
eukprot:1866652-Amphidinium_carterae.1